MLSEVKIDFITNVKYFLVPTRIIIYHIIIRLLYKSSKYKRN